MIKKINISALILFLMLTILSVYFVIKATRVYEDTDLNFLEDCDSYSEFDLVNEVKNIDSNEIITKFPYKKYLNEAKYCDIKNINSHIYILDSLYNNHRGISLEILKIAFTDSLKNSNSENLIQYNPEFLNNKLEWAKQMNTYSKCFPKNRRLFRIVHKYWMNVISMSLSKFQGEKPDLKFDYTFKYLTTNISLEKYSMSYGFSKSQKIVNYLAEGRYMYIWNRIYKSTGWLTKFGLIILIFSTIFTYSFTIYKLFKKFIKK